MMRIEEFYSLSVPLTGFSETELKGTAAAPTYFAQLLDAVGEKVLIELDLRWKLIQKAAKGDQEKIKTGLRQEILSDPMLGPVTRNIMKMWYIATWYPLPNDWMERYVYNKADPNPIILSPQAYKEGLVWKAIGRHPMGAKWPGYGSWEVSPDHLKDVF